MPLLWASSRASAICLAISRASSSGNGAAGEPLLEVFPLHELEGEEGRFPSASSSP